MKSKVKRGILTVVTGPMFSGKTSFFLDKYRRAKDVTGLVCVLFKPETDNRWNAELVMTHNGDNVEAIVVSRARNILFNIPEGCDRVFVSEAQFFDAELPAVVKAILRRGIEVYVEGLSRDYAGDCFGSMPELLSLAQIIETLAAVCDHEDPDTGRKCGNPAYYTQRLRHHKPVAWGDTKVVIGGSAEDSGGISYVARCEDHYILEQEPPSLWDILEMGGS